MTISIFSILCLSLFLSCYGSVPSYSPATSRGPTRSPTAGPTSVAGVSPKVNFYNSGTCATQLYSNTLPFQTYQSTSCQEIIAENIYSVPTTYYAEVICYGGDDDDYYKGSFSIQFYTSSTCSGNPVGSSSGYTNTLCMYEYMSNGYTYSSYDFTVDCTGGSS